MNLPEIIDLADKAVAHASAGDISELEITFNTPSDPGVQTGTYEPEPPPQPDEDP